MSNENNKVVDLLTLEGTTYLSVEVPEKASQHIIAETIFKTLKYADKIDFTNMDLQFQVVKNIYFDSCDFRFADLEGTVFENCTFDNCKFNPKTNLKDVQFNICKFDHIDFNWVDLNGVTTNNCSYWFVTTDWTLNNNAFPNTKVEL